MATNCWPLAAELEGIDVARLVSDFASATSLHPLHADMTLARRPDRVALALTPAGCPVGPVDLDHLEAVGTSEANQASPIGAGAFHADALHRPEVFGPGDQGDIAAGRGRERLGGKQPPGVIQDRGHVQVQVGVDPDGDGCGWGWHAFQWPFLPGRSDRDGTHPSGRWTALRWGL